jgi:hypothetical protein
VPLPGDDDATSPLILTLHAAIDTDTARTLKKPCSGTISTNGHNGSTTLLHATLGEVQFDPFHSKKNRFTRLWKCSRRVRPMPLAG